MTHCLFGLCVWCGLTFYILWLVFNIYTHTTDVYTYFNTLSQSFSAILIYPEQYLHRMIQQASCYKDIRCLCVSAIFIWFCNNFYWCYFLALNITLVINIMYFDFEKFMRSCTNSSFLSPESQKRCFCNHLFSQHARKTSPNIYIQTHFFRKVWYVSYLCFHK